MRREGGLCLANVARYNQKVVWRSASRSHRQGAGRQDDRAVMCQKMTLDAHQRQREGFAA